MKLEKTNGNCGENARAVPQALDALRVTELQPYGKIVKSSIALDEKACTDNVCKLNQLLADTMTLRDLYKKHRWQTSGTTSYQLHLLFEKHSGEQGELIDLLAARIRTLGGVTIAMAVDAAEMTLIPRPPRGHEHPQAQLARLLHAHEIVLQEARAMARLAAGNDDVGTNDILVGDVIRTNELQACFVSQQL